MSLHSYLVFLRGGHKTVVRAEHDRVFKDQRGKWRSFQTSNDDTITLRLDQIVAFTLIR